MRHFLTIFGHEIRMLLVNTSTYLAAVVFLFVTGFIFTFLLEMYTDRRRRRRRPTTSSASSWVPVFIIVPLTTMKSFLRGAARWARWRPC